MSSRDNKTAIELFLAGVRGWESVLQRRLDNAKPKETRSYDGQYIVRLKSTTTVPAKWNGPFGQQHRGLFW